MTQRECKQAERLLHLLREAKQELASGGVAIGVEFASDGEQRIFHTLAEVKRATSKAESGVAE